MIWIWLALAVMPTLGFLAIGWLLVDRWWHRRKARKHAEAQAVVMAACPSSVGCGDRWAHPGLVPAVGPGDERDCEVDRQVRGGFPGR